jgi:uracil-DNA glycosylase
MDVAKSLSDDAARKARQAALSRPHIAPLVAFAERLRERAKHAAHVPHFDPLDGGVLAQCLFLLEAPGGKAVSSGFVSRNNPDETAKNWFLLNEEAGLRRTLTVIWNVVPWYVGNGVKIRAVTAADVAASAPHLRELLQLLPALRAIVLVGRKAQRAKPLLKLLASHCTIFECAHPSPLSLNGRPERRSEILQCLKAVGAHLKGAGRRRMGAKNVQAQAADARGDG